MRALKQNPAAAVQAAAGGEQITVTDRGRPVAQLMPISASPLTDLLTAGLARPPRRPIAGLPDPIMGLDLSTSLAELREGERY